MSPVDLEIHSDSEVEESLESASDSDSKSYEQNDFEERQKKSGWAEVRDIASADTNKVHRWKTLTFFLLLATTAVVSAGTYYFLEREEDDNYRESYGMLMNAVQGNVQSHFSNLEQGLQGLRQILASPVPNWHDVGATTRAQSRATVIAYSPLVETRADIPEYFDSVEEQADWYRKSVDAMVKSGQGDPSDYDLSDLGSEIYNLDANNLPYPVNGTGPFAPLWLMTPPPLSASTVHYNLLDHDMGQVDQLNQTRTAFFSRLLLPGDAPDFIDMVLPEDSQSDGTGPHSIYWVPVLMDPYGDETKMVGYLTASLTWDQYVLHLLPQNIDQGIVCVIRNSCEQAATYEVVGKTANYLGPGDLHDTQYDATERVFLFGDSPSQDSASPQCHYTFVFYATKDFEEGYRSNQPIVITAVVGGAFAVVIVTFLCYNLFVERRNRKVVSVASKTNEIVASLFPEAVRRRLFDDKEEASKRKTKAKKASAEKDDPRERLMKKYLSGTTEMDDELNDKEDFMYKSRPIADLYPSTTIMFADIAGFTAWSSTRDPAQVFTLLETFYKAFDEIASRRGIFKVETIGDCYVAVAGLPEPRDDHAVVMCRFAHECLERMKFLSQKLEVHLGPDTAELEMRAGLHSGPVTAGVLRGVRSRFQLFGDTMNTASRMESTGHRGKIQVSQETADLLVAAGKMSWITPREERIVAKGKGELQTYWVNIGTTIVMADGYSSIDGSLSYEDGPFASLSPKSVRLVLWNVEILLDLLRQIHVLRGKNDSAYQERVILSKNNRKIAYEEVKDVINFPSHYEQTEINTDGVQLKPEVEAQLEDFLSTIASMYIEENAFHDFAHASHATMGVVKLLSSLVKGKPQEDNKQNAAYLIASNPLVQFAIVLSVITHDVDHPGVSNCILRKEKTRMASVYGFRSIAEQNSFDLAWDLLMDDAYADLRSAIYQSDEEKNLFRQILVNCIVSTDLFDKDLKQRFDSRWNVAFSRSRAPLEDHARHRNLQATLIVETLAQASDIAHAMQHWQVYRKWNIRLFEEVYQSFADKRLDDDPTEDWFQNEVDFFDNFVLPLVRRLHDCGAFVAASTDSHRDYADQNRTLWLEQGRELVAEMGEAAKSKIVARDQESPLGLQS